MTITIKDKELTIEELKALYQMEDQARTEFIETELADPALKPQERADILDALKHGLEKIITDYEETRTEVSHTRDRDLTPEERQEKLKILADLKAIIDAAKEVENNFDDAEAEFAERFKDFTHGEEGAVNPQLNGATYIVEMGGSAGSDTDVFGHLHPEDAATEEEGPRQILHFNVPAGATVESVTATDGMIEIILKDEDGKTSKVQVKGDIKAIQIDFNTGITSDLVDSLVVKDTDNEEKKNNKIDLQKALSINGKSFFLGINGVEGTEEYQQAVDITTFDKAYDDMKFTDSSNGSNVSQDDAKKIYADSVKMLLEDKSMDDIVQMWKETATPPLTDDQIPTMAAILVAALKEANLYEEYVVPNAAEIIGLIDKDGNDLSGQEMAVLLLLDPTYIDHFPTHRSTADGSHIRSSTPTPGWDNPETLTQALEFYLALGGDRTNADRAKEEVRIYTIFHPDAANPADPEPVGEAGAGGNGSGEPDPTVVAAESESVGAAQNRYR